MYYSYSYYSMKPKADRVRSTYVSGTSSSTYNDWEYKIEGSGNTAWLTLCEKYAESMQYAILRGITVVGISRFDWSDIFRNIGQENRPFENLAKLYWQRQIAADWRFFADKIAKETYESIHYPAGCPVWLFPYGYTQRQYLDDLAVYWENIHDEYYKPWDTTKLGQDSPEIARLKKIGQAARQEIDEVARHGAGHLKR